ncbi:MULTISPECIES: hypothetical protein [unclassified Endozoicomonas]|uniref:hypothetical protein n=1 Tax=unclassified Endozoicomonas TaxID=2644528 RepID=UPI003BAEABBF
MNHAKFFKSLLLFVLSCFAGMQVANAELNSHAKEHDGVPLSVYSADCPHNQICTGDIVQIGMADFSAHSDITMVHTMVHVAKNAYDLSEGYTQMASIGSFLNGFYYRVKPGKTYYFRATYSYRESSGHLGRVTRDLYFKSRDDSHNPGGYGEDGPIYAGDPGTIGLPSIPKCHSGTAGEFCANQVVHIFWNNNRGQEARVIDVDLYIDGQHTKHGDGPYYGGNFQDFYYVLPDSKYSGVPVRFQVTWKVWGWDSSAHFENSQILVSKYTPERASACKLNDHWLKCQDRSSGR